MPGPDRGRTGTERAAAGPAEFGPRRPGGDGDRQPHPGLVLRPGRHLDDAAALAAVDRAVDEGAAIVDVGGVKAGPGRRGRRGRGDPADAPASSPRSARRHPDLVISVDTWRAEVGRAVCEAGADLLNDAWRGADPGLAEVAAEYGAGLVCSHAGGLPPRTDPHRVGYDDVMADVVATVTAARPSARSRSAYAGTASSSTRARLRQEHLALAGGDPPAGRAGRHRLAGAVAVSNKDFVGETLDADGRPARGHARGHRARRLAGRPGLPRARRRRDPAGAPHRRRGPGHPAARRLTPGAGLTRGGTASSAPRRRPRRRRRSP